MTRPWKVTKVRQFRFRALVTLDPVEPRPGALHPPARQYPNHTRALVILALPLRAGTGPARSSRRRSDGTARSRCAPETMPQ
jgi:hypothetical protein